MVHGALMNPDGIYSGLFFNCLFDALLSEWSWIINPDRDNPKETYPQSENILSSH